MQQRSKVQNDVRPHTKRHTESCSQARLDFLFSEFKVQQVRQIYTNPEAKRAKNERPSPRVFKQTHRSHSWRENETSFLVSRAYLLPKRFWQTNFGRAFFVDLGFYVCISVTQQKKYAIILILIFILLCLCGINMRKLCQYPRSVASKPSRVAQHDLSADNARQVRVRCLLTKG